MGLIVPDGYAHVAVEMVLAGLSRPAYVTFGVSNTAATQAGINAVFDAFTDSLSARMDTSVTMRAAIGAFGTTSGEPLSLRSSLAAVAGGAALTSLPANCALLIHKFTGRGGRRGRGRMFIPWGVDEGTCDEAGVIQASAITAWNTALETWRGRQVSEGSPLCVLHNSEGNSAPGGPDDVSALVASPIISTQRRRVMRSSF